MDPAKQILLFGTSVGADPLAPGALSLAWATTFSDTTPDFTATLVTGQGAPKNSAAGDVLTIYVNGNSVDTYTLQASDIVAGTVTRTLGAIAAGIRNATARLVRGTHVSNISNQVAFKIGKILIGYGQSNWGGHTDQASSPPAAATGSAYWDGSSWTSVPSANGVRELLNFLTTDSGYPWGLVSHAQAAVGISSLMNNGVDPHFGLLAAKVAASGGDADFVIWHQGEGDGVAGTMTTDVYVANLDTLHGQLVALVSKTKAQCPLVTSSLARYAGATALGWWRINEAHVKAGAVNSNIHFSHSNLDAGLVDGLHWDAVSYGRSGRRYAQTVAKVNGTESVKAAWFVASAAIVDATHTDVTLAHSLGTDFTPTSGATGFEVSVDNGANWETPSAAARQSATVIRLTHSSMATSIDRLIRYDYGNVPDVSAAVLDNSSINAPLNYTGNQTIQANGSASLPTPTYLSTGVTNASGVRSGVSIGTADSNRLLIVGVQKAGSFTDATLTITPNAGSPVAATKLGSDVSALGGCGLLFQAIVPTGTTADFSLSDTSVNTVVSVWSVNAADMSSTTPTDVKTDRRSGTFASVDLATSTGGFIIALHSVAGFDGVAISGDQAYAERYVNGSSGGNCRGSDASNISTDAANTVGSTTSGTVQQSIVAAAWR